MIPDPQSMVDGYVDRDSAANGGGDGSYHASSYGDADGEGWSASEGSGHGSACGAGEEADDQNGWGFGDAWAGTVFTGPGSYTDPAIYRMKHRLTK